MRKFILIIPLLLLLMPVSAQEPLLVVAGDSFKFTLDKYLFPNDTDTGEDTELTFEDDDSTARIILLEGDSFTYTIIDPSITKDDDGNDQILVKYIKDGVSFETLEPIGFGWPIIRPDWDLYREEFSATSTDLDEDETFTVIDNNEEFGYIDESSYSYTDTDGSYEQTYREEYRYSKDTVSLI